MKNDILTAARQAEQERGAAIDDGSRPVFHLSPYSGWLNDPNGFSFYKGEYHLFYQYNPYDSCWDTMHWGHAVSKNLLDWKYLPAALAPDTPWDVGGCFSGSAAELSDGKQLLMYTGLRRPVNEEEAAEAASYGKEYLQVQNLAIGDGRDYEKYGNNPVIGSHDVPQGMSRVEFRDPKIIRRKDGTLVALMTCMNEDGNGEILMYKSMDGFSWSFWKTLAKNDGKFGRMWECPDFFELDGKWLLLVSPMEMKPEGLEYHNGFGCMVLAGEYDDEKGIFVPDFDQSVDYGIDFYAAQTMLAPDGRRIMIAWMQNWDTCLMREQSKPWAGQMTLPRELSFKDGRLYQRPIREIEQHFTNIVSYENVPVSDEISLYGIEGRVVDLDITVRPAPDEPLYRKFAVWFAMDQENHSAVRFNPYDGTVKIDRKYSGSRKAIVHQRRCLVRESMDGNIRIRIILDRYSFEVFINDGRYVMTAAILTDVHANGISFRVEGNAIMDVTKRDIRI